MKFFSFIGKSVALGIIISAIILALVPDLRRGSGLSLDVFSRKPQIEQKQSYYTAISQSAPAVVNIYSTSIDVRSNGGRRQQVNRTSLGSGVIMTENGYVLTCWHVIKNAESTFVTLQDSRFVSAELVGFDEITDLAVLKINADNLHVIPQLDDPKTRVGDVVLAIGNPLNIGQSITSGIVSRSGHNITQNFIDFIQTDAVLNEGNSGGALVDSNGVLIGINNADFKTLDRQGRVVDANGIFFAVPYSLARRVMDEIISNGKATHGQLGFVGAKIIDGLGVVILSIEPGSPADKAGLQLEDVILTINSAELASLDQTLNMIAKSTPGDTLELTVSRDGSTSTVNVIVGEATRN